MNTITKYGLTFLTGFLLAITICCIMINSCTRKTNTPVKPDAQKQKVSLLKQDKKKLKAEIVYKEKIRDRWHTKYKEVRHDSLIPCPEKLAVADTVIRIDSYLIASLKQVILVDSLIIFTQDSIIKNDSIALRKANKTIRRLRFWNTFWKTTTVIAAGANAVRR